MLFLACTFFTYGLYPVDKAFTSFLFSCFWLEIYFLKIDFSVQYYFIAYAVFNDFLKLNAAFFLRKQTVVDVSISTTLL